MFHIAICDDEEYFRLREKKLIEQYMENCGYTCRIDLYASGKELLKQADRDITYALEGYKVGAVRYLLKEDNSLENSLKECLDTITMRINEEKAVYELEFQGGKNKIPADALLYVESRLHKVVFFVKENGIEVGISKKYYKDVEKEYIKRQGEI